MFRVVVRENENTIFETIKPCVYAGFKIGAKLRINTLFQSSDSVVGFVDSVVDPADSEEQERPPRATITAAPVCGRLVPVHAYSVPQWYTTG